MSDALQEDVWSVINKGRLKGYHDVTITKDAIAAAEPHLRRKHRQELLDELEDRARTDGLWTIRNRSPRKASPLSQWFWQFREETE